MKRIYLSLIILLFSVSFSFAQTPTKLCIPTNGANCITVDANNPLPVTGGGGGGGNDAASATGSAVPADADYQGLNVSGTLRGATGLGLGSTFSQTVAIVDASGNQITSFGSSASVSATGSTVPASANFNGINVAGNLRGLSGLATGSIFPAAVGIVDASGNQITSFGSTTNLAPITPNTATATQSSVLGMQYNSTQATFTNTQQGSVQGTARGALYVATGADTFTTTSAATESHIGEVGSSQITILNNITTSNATVTTGKAIGGLQTLASAARVSGSNGASGTGGMIQTVVLSFKDAIGTIPMDIYFFNANPSGSTCTDNTTFALVAADYNKMIGISHVTDWTASNTAAIGQANNQAIAFSLASATSIFACVVTRASAAITGTSNAAISLNILRN